MLKNTNIITTAAAAALALFAGTALVSAGDRGKAHLGPVGPYQPILAQVGSSRLLAYYEPDGGSCALSAVMFSDSEKGVETEPTRVRVALHPGEQFDLANPKGDRVILACAPNAKGMTVLNPGELTMKSASSALY